MSYFNKHFLQIKKGGVPVIAKKLISLFYLLLILPTYIPAVPAVIIARLISPWFLIRWEKLPASRIGHLAITTELYCCLRDAGINFPSQKHVDLFYLPKIISNKQFVKMWGRKLTILPTWLLIPLVKTNLFFDIFIPSNKAHQIDQFDEVIFYSDRDTYNLLDRFQSHLNFTHDEEIRGKKILKSFGIPENAKFVCLIVRDSAYLDRYKKFTTRDWSYHDYRDGDIDNYVLAAEELARRGYYIFRMGVKVLKPLKSSNPKVIDYANSGVRSDFMDIYLGAKCSFCISADAGFEKVATVFRRPLVSREMPFGLIHSSCEKDLAITKHHFHKKYKRELTISEIFLANVAISKHTNEFEQNDVYLEENSPEEIKDVVVEMDDRLNGNWNETKEDLLLQKKFWSIYKENLRRLNLGSLHGKIKVKFGAKYLRDNQNLIR